MDTESLTRDFHDRFDAKNAAREQALPLARRSIRASANAIRAVHRLEFDRATELIGESRAAIEAGLAAVADHPDVRFVAGEDLPTPTVVGVVDAPYLNGMAEAIGEGRRHILDLLRGGDVVKGESMLAAMEDMYGVLVTMDYPDAITMNLRRSTDVARSLIEKTRGDLSIAFVQRDLHDALERHAERFRDPP